MLTGCVAEAATSDRSGRETRQCTYLAVTAGLKQTCWKLLAVLRRGKIHIGGGKGVVVGDGVHRCAVVVCAGGSEVAGGSEGDC
jgi:hypothetical protein